MRCETPAPHGARIVMARPEAHNAQGLQTTYELNAAFDQVAQEAAARGMVNRIVPRDGLAAATLALAEKIATKPAFALKATKQALNHVQDVQGRRNAQMHVFSLHHLLHTHDELVHGMPMDPNGLPEAVREKVLARVA